MWELDCEESWVPKNWCFWTVVLEKTLESPSMDCMEIQPVHSKGDQSWDFFGRNDAKAETPVLWPPHEKSWLIGKDSDAGRDWGQEEKGTTEDEMAGWHHWLDGRESEWTLGVGDGQGGLACCDSWGRRVGHDWATELNWTETATIGKHSVHLMFQRAGNLCNHVGREKEVLDASKEGREKSSQSARIAPNLEIELFWGNNFENLILLWFFAQVSISL